jgi:hypothetical protein
MSSKFTDIMTEIVAGVTAITSIKKVYQYISNLDDGQAYPRAEVFNGEEELKHIDVQAKAWESEFMVIINIYAQPSELEAIIYELKKYIVSIFMTHITDSTNKWNVIKDKGIKVGRVNLPENESMSWGQLYFFIHSRYHDTNL